MLQTETYSEVKKGLWVFGLARTLYKTALVERQIKHDNVL